MRFDVGEDFATGSTCLGECPLAGLDNDRLQTRRVLQDLIEKLPVALDGGPRQDSAMVRCDHLDRVIFEDVREVPPERLSVSTG